MRLKWKYEDSYSGVVVVTRNYTSTQPVLLVEEEEIGSSYWRCKGNCLQMKEVFSIKELILPLETDIILHMLFCERVLDKPFREIHVHLCLNMNYTTRIPTM